MPHDRIAPLCVGLLLAAGLLATPSHSTAATAQSGASVQAAQASHKARETRPRVRKPSVDARRGELKALQARIEDLGQAAAETEERQVQARDRLRATEAAIAELNRELRQLAGQRSDAEAALQLLEQQALRIERQIADQQRQLGELLRRQFVNGDVDALRMLLSGDDAQQATRDLHYLTLLSRAKADLLNVLRRSLAEKQQLGEAVQVKRGELAAIERQQQQQRSQLLAQQTQRQALLTALGDRLKAQRREIDTLKRDELRLGRLVEQLARLAAAQAKAARKAAARRPASPSPAKAATGLSEPATTNARTAATAPLRNDREPQPEPELAAFAGNFRALKGRLRLPVRGDVVHRFGTPRVDGGATWKGLFIVAPEGAEVRSPAAGRVVFADWLRGFGNLLIVDHGDAWLSVYGNNQSLLRHVGDIVRTGDPVATVGNSGGNAESGLYFELRQQGKPVDPLAWVALR